MRLIWLDVKHFGEHIGEDIEVCVDNSAIAAVASHELTKCEVFDLPISLDDKTEVWTTVFNESLNDGGAV